MFCIGIWCWFGTEETYVVGCEVGAVQCEHDVGLLMRAYTVPLCSVTVSSSPLVARRSTDSDMDVASIHNLGKSVHAS